MTLFFELVATFCTALFAGAALYINLVEHPARLEVGVAAAVQEWRPSYRRATVMQASLALAGFAAALVAWIQGGGLPVLVAGLLLGSVVPITLIVISPTNRGLGDPALDLASERAATLLARWNRLHALRTGLALVSLALFLLHLVELV